MSTPSTTPDPTKVIDRLTGSENYAIWRSKIQVMLQYQKAWFIIDKGEEGNSSPPDILSTEKKAAWSDAYALSAYTIYMSLGQEPTLQVLDFSHDPVKMWRVLEETYHPKNAGALYSGLSALQSLVKDEDESLESLISRFRALKSEVKKLISEDAKGKDVVDDIAIICLLHALPQNYESIRQSLFSLPKLSEQHVEEVLRRQSLNEQQQKAIALATVSRKPPAASRSDSAASAPKPDSSSNLRCLLHSNSTNHSTEDCKVLRAIISKDKETPRKPRGREKGNSAQSSEDTPASPVESAGSASSSLPPGTHADDWCADTAATSHMTFRRDWISDLKPCSVSIELADHTQIYAKGVGSIRLIPSGCASGKPITLTNVLYVPDLQINLLSVLHLTQKKEYTVTIDSSAMNFYMHGLLQFRALVKGNLAYIDGRTQPAEFAHVTSLSPPSQEIWHSRLCHVNYRYLHELYQKGLVSGLTMSSSSPEPRICEPCIMGKQHRDPFPHQATHRATQLLELIHSDLHGPLPVQSHSGYRYWVSFIDDYSRYTTVYLLKNKSDTAYAFKQFKAYAENQTGRSIKVLRDDKGGEYSSKEFAKYLALAGIDRQRTAPGTPQQNGVAERFNRTAQERVTSMLTESEFSPGFWAEALTTYIHVHNMCPTSAVKGSTPYELWHKRKPDVSHLRIFGCTAYVLIQDHKRKSLQPHSIKCKFLGYEPGIKAWRFWDSKGRKVMVSRDVKFVEIPVSKPDMSHGICKSYDKLYTDGICKSYAKPTSATGNTPSDFYVPPLPAPLEPAARDEEHIPEPENQHEPARPDEQPARNEPVAQNAPAAPRTPPPARRSARPRTAPVDYWRVPDAQRFRDTPRPERVQEAPQHPAPDLPRERSESPDPLLIGPEAAHSIVHREPVSYKHAMKGSDAALWQAACLQEYNSLLENGTWELVDLPPGRKAIGHKWVFKIKLHADGTIDRYKARLTAQGFSQKADIDYHELFAPVAKFSSIRVVLSIATILDWEIDQIDFETAFLNGDIEEEIYMTQPEGFHHGDSNKVCKLKRSLYGLKQSSRCWNEKLHAAMLDLGFKRIYSDYAIYIYNSPDKHMHIPIYVDDGIMACNSRQYLDHVKSELSKRFKLKDLGPIHHILGLEITRDRSKRQLFLSQSYYLQTVLERFNMQDCNPCSTPLPPAPLLHSMSPKTEQEKEEMRKVPYINVVGSLMYLAVATRPDIAHAVGVISQFNANPGSAHWSAAKRILRYLKGTPKYALRLGLTTPQTTPQIGIKAYSDADWAGDRDTRKSTSAYAMFLGDGLVSWSSKRQPVVALSTTEAEYISAVHAGQEIIWLRNILGELGFPQVQSTPLFIDNQSAIATSKNPENHSRIKHMDIRLFWLRDQISKNVIEPSYKHTTEMVADILTKSLGSIAHNRCIKGLGLVDLGQSALSD